MAPRLASRDVQGVAAYLASDACQRVVVLTGAGVSWEFWFSTTDLVLDDVEANAKLLTTGASLALIPRFDPAVAAQTVRECAVDVFIDYCR